MGVSIQVQPTPNINALKFVLDRQVTAGRGQTYRAGEEGTAPPLAQRLLGIHGVVQVFFLNDFITVTRNPEVPWETLAPQVEAAIRSHYA